MSRILLRGAQVVTMSPHRADAEDIDILIDGDRIAEIGDRLRADDVETVDLSGRIVIPGLVNAHLHTWQTALRFAGTDWTLPDYLAQAHGVAARHYRPEDMRIGTAAGAVSQINSGVTTIGDWCHNCSTPEHADAAVEGLQQAGVRAVFLHGTPHALRDRPHDTREIDRLIDGAIGASDQLSVGMAIKGPQLSKPDVALADLRAATERGVLASMHQSAGAPGTGWEAVRAAGLWGPLTNIVHGTGLTDDTVRELVDAGATITSTPENELGQGHCTAVVDHLLRCGAAPSLGTDTEVVVAGDMLVAARLCLAQHRGTAHAHEYQRTGLGAPQMPLTAKHALSWATLEGARALGLADRIGTIEPGKQADLVILDGRMLNLWPSHDPVAAALNSTTANIESVMVAGAWRKRDHVLLAGPVDELMDELQKSGERILREIRRTGVFARVQRRVVQQVVRRQLRHQAQPHGRPKP